MESLFDHDLQICKLLQIRFLHYMIHFNHYFYPCLCTLHGHQILYQLCHCLFCSYWQCVYSNCQHLLSQQIVNKFQFIFTNLILKCKNFFQQPLYNCVDLDNARFQIVSNMPMIINTSNCLIKRNCNFCDDEQLLNSNETCPIITCNLRGNN